MDPALPLVTYVLVNWNTEDLLDRALASIAAQTYPRREVIVVDNGSPAFDPGKYQAMDGIKVLLNCENRGFAAANNQAIAVSSGEFIIPLNCDAFLDPGFTECALDVFSSGPGIGTVVPKILKDDGSGEIDSTGHIMHTDRTPAHRGKGELDCGQFEQGGYVFGGTAAAIMYRRSMLTSVSDGDEVFPELFFAYYEDVDLDWRANLAGYRAYYEPKCVAWHRGHGSGGRKQYLVQLRAEKNRYLMMLRNDSWASIGQDAGAILLYEHWHLARTVLKPWLWPAYLALLWNLPETIAARRRLSSSRAQGAASIEFSPRGFQAPIRAEQPRSNTPPGAEEPQAPALSVVVLNFNGLDQTRACLKSIYSQDFDDFEVIVVDNGSSTPDFKLIGREFPQAQVVRNSQNQGFSGGVNWGVSMARGRYIALVNNDCILEPSCLGRLYNSIKSGAHAAVSGRLVDVPDTVSPEKGASAIHQEANGECISTGSSNKLYSAILESRRNHGISFQGFQVLDAYEGKAECFYPSGGLCIIDREAVADLLPELFPHGYFAYHEDVWLGFAVRASGGSVGKESGALALHVASSTARNLGQAKLKFLQERNRWLNLLGFAPARYLGRLLPAWLTGNVLSAVSLTRAPAALAGLVAAHWWLLFHLPSIHRWRARCQALGKADTAWNDLSGKLAGRGGMLNMLSLAWCRVLGIPCRENNSSRPG